MNVAGGSEPRQGRAPCSVLPWDLGEWVDPRDLLQWTEQEVDRLDWTRPQVTEYLGRHPDYHPRLLLCVLTWCYVTRRFESGEIERACVHERPLRELCGNWLPSESEIARFRRDNRGLLKWSMAQLLRRVLRSKLSLGDSYFPSGLGRSVDANAVMRLDIARQMDRGASGF